MMLLFLIVAVFATRAFFKVTTVATDTTFSKEYALTLSDYNGVAVHLYDYRRKVLVAYAWASWCPYCALELQNLSVLKKTYGENIQIVAINRGESLQVARTYTNAISNVDGIVFLLDPMDAFFKEIGGYAMPETVFIDGGGDIIFHQRGPIHIEEVRAKIEELLH